jgi:hypothetical protein
VVIVSVLEDGPLLKRLLEAGAAGYIGKGCDAQELLRAVRDVAAGRRYLGTSIAQNLALSTVEGNGSPFDNLSPRELEVALLLTQGLRQEDIARRLSLSAKTVNTHKARLFEKMGIHDNMRWRGWPASTGWWIRHGRCKGSGQRLSPSRCGRIRGVGPAEWIAQGTPESIPGGSGAPSMALTPLAAIPPQGHGQVPCARPARN